VQRFEGWERLQRRRKRKPWAIDALVDGHDEVSAHLLGDRCDQMGVALTRGASFDPFLNNLEDGVTIVPRRSLINLRQYKLCGKGVRPR
jgi:hypothetical protein